jgi:hypothetical protein
MGCFPSVPSPHKRGGTLQKMDSGVPGRAEADHRRHEFVDCEDATMLLPGDITGNGNVVSTRFFDAVEHANAGDSDPDEDDALVNSALVEHASSKSSSGGCTDRPSSPELAISPNPTSPEPGRPMARSIFGRIVNLKSPDIPQLSEPNTAIVAPGAATAVESVVVHNRPLATSYRSRLEELAQARTRFLLLQVFSLWRTDVLRVKSDSMRAKLEGAAKASEIILNENSKLKQRLAELERAIAIVHSIPTSTVATGTEDLVQSFAVESSTPVQASVGPKLEEFMTPPSRGVDIPAEFVTPDSAPRYEPEEINIGTPPEEAARRRSWTNFLRPSLLGKAPEAPPFKSPAPAVIEPVNPPVAGGRKEKLKAITEDLFKLSESLAAVDTRLRRDQRKAMGS